jgi:GNAT superfamily N-acetyltransferase
VTVEIKIIDGDAADLAREVEEALDEAAKALGKPFDDEGINLRASDGDGGFLGGLSGQILQRWLYVRLLAVAPQARTLGVGRALMAGGEEEARRRGLVGVYLDTYDFQAPGFYEKLGYSEFGRLPAVGDAPQRIYFAKPFGGDRP